MLCKKCSKEKPETDFPLQKDKKFKRNSYCYECKRAAEKARYKKNKEKYGKNNIKWKYGKFDILLWQAATFGLRPLLTGEFVFNGRRLENK